MEIQLSELSLNYVLKLLVLKLSIYKYLCLSCGVNKTFFGVSWWIDLILKCYLAKVIFSNLRLICYCL